jgi:hypothetical protein
VQDYRRYTGVLGDPASVEERAVLVIDADPELHRDGKVPGRLDRGADDLAEQGSLVGQRRTASSAGDLRDRAPEVEVNVISEIVVAHHLHGLADRRGIDPVELHRAGLLRGIEADHPQGAGVPLHQCPASDHLADVQPGAVVAAQPTERHIGDPGHRREHDRRIDPIGANPQWRPQCRHPLIIPFAPTPVCSHLPHGGSSTPLGG